VDQHAHGGLPTISVFRLHHNLDILVERDEERKEPFCQKRRQMTTNQRGNFWLIDAPDMCRLGLAPPLFRNDRVIRIVRLALMKSPVPSRRRR